MIELVLRYIVPCAYAVLPPRMNSPAATAELLAIGLQESKFLHRRQLPRKPGGLPGPASGLWQFERNGGIKGVINHPLTKGPLATALTELRYAAAIDRPDALHAIVEHNDVVACVCARLLLWTVPMALPGRDEAGRGWSQYLDGWRPGEPHRETWNNYYIEAWARVDQQEIQTP